MKHQSIALYVSFLLFVTSCQPSNEVENTEEMKLSVASKLVDFEIPKDFSGMSEAIQYYKDSDSGSEYVAILSLESASLILFDLKSSTLVSSIVLDSDGPDAVVNPNSF